ncbi:MAG TPA: hypothetical protein VGG95_03360 [Edaphobacter sp.]|jgi:hypothetical protein
MDPGLIVFSVVGVSVLLPLGARFAGNRRLANRLDLLPRFCFGMVCLALALLPDSTFSYADDLGREMGPAAQSSSRILFGALGIYLLAGAVRIIAKRDYDSPDTDD